MKYVTTTKLKYHKCFIAVSKIDGSIQQRNQLHCVVFAIELHVKTERSILAHRVGQALEKLWSKAIFEYHEEVGLGRRREGEPSGHTSSESGAQQDDQLRRP